MFKLKAPSILAFCSSSLNKLRLSMKPLRTSTTLAAAHTVAGVGFSAWFALQLGRVKGQLNRRQQDGGGISTTSSRRRRLKEIQHDRP